MLDNSESEFTRLEELQAAIRQKYALPAHAQVSQEGLLAMKYKRQQRALVTCKSRGETHQYVFAVRANISMAWVRPEDVPCCQAKTGGCCGQKKPGIIAFANEADVRRWTNGGGR